MKYTGPLINTLNLAYYEKLHNEFYISHTEYLLLKYINQTSKWDGFSHAKLKTINEQLGYESSTKYIAHLIHSLTIPRIKFGVEIPPLLSKNKNGLQLLFEWEEEAFISSKGGYIAISPKVRLVNRLTPLQYGTLKFLENLATRYGSTCTDGNDEAFPYIQTTSKSIAASIGIEARNVKRILDSLVRKGEIVISHVKMEDGSFIFPAIIIKGGISSLEENAGIPKAKDSHSSRFVNHAEQYEFTNGEWPPQF